MFKNRNKCKRLFVIVALSLLAAFILTATLAHAWPWRTAWASFKVKNKTGYNCNRIVGGGLSLLKVTKCMKGGSPKFPNCWVGNMYIGKYGLGWITGYYFGDRTTGPGITRKIGFGRRFCCAIVGAGVWLQNGFIPRGWFPLVGFKCTSPVSFVVDDSIPQPFRVTDIEYAVSPNIIPFDSLDYDNPLPWEPSLLQDLVVYASDSISIPGLPDESFVADNVLFLRGHLIADIETEDASYVDTVDFAVEILMEEEIPTLTEWGLIIFGVVLLGFITWVFLRRRRAAISLR